MNALALILYAILAVVGFGWRTWVQWRRTGDTGLRLHADPGSVAWWAKLAFIAAIAAGVAAPIAGLAGLDPVTFLDHPALRTTGVVVALAGIAATAIAQLQMGTSWRVGVDPNERTELVTTGIFARVRNPIFTAMAITAAGLALVVANIIGVIGFAALVIALQLQVRAVEEPYLRRVHGPAYDRYLDTTSRFLPGL